MTRNGENIYKRKDGRWEGRYIIKSAKGSKYGYVYAKECIAIIVDVRLAVESVDALIVMLK